MTKGYAFLLSGYIGWGLFPLYWHLLAHVNPWEVTLHRILWSVPVLFLLVYLVKRRRDGFYTALKDKHVLKVLAMTALFITINWGVYVWAVAHQRVVEASMGYFLSPLVSILAGVLVFRERLQPLKWLAVACAAAGVLYYIFTVDTFPWVALTVGASFAIYGILRKQVNVDSVPGLFIETLILAPLALLVVIGMTVQGNAEFLHGEPLDDVWLILGGAVTVAPLALFTAGARLLPLATVGILFFVTPTMQFFSGVLVLGEPMDMYKLVGFMGIWLGLVFYCIALFSEHVDQSGK